jgi:hypothetical protein
LQIISKEGPMALYKGFLPNFARIGTWNIVVCVKRLRIASVCAYAH